MKRLVAVVLMVALVLSLSVTAFALKSPQGEGVHKVHIINGKGGKVETKVLENGEYIYYKVNTYGKDGKFTGWKIYVFENRKIAVLGDHYKLGEGETLASNEIHLYPLTDLIVVATYDNEEPEFQIGQNGEVTSPQTGDTVAWCMAGVMLVTLAGMLVVGKKRFA